VRSASSSAGKTPGRDSFRPEISGLASLGICQKNQAEAGGQCHHDETWRKRTGIEFAKMAQLHRGLDRDGAKCDAGRNRQFAG